MPRIEVTEAEDLGDNENSNGAAIWTIPDGEKKRAKRRVGESIRDEMAVIGSGMKKVPSLVSLESRKLARSVGGVLTGVCENCQSSFMPLLDFLR